jgi:hypothetical protein
MVATVVRAFASMPSLTMDQIVARARKGRRRDGGDRLGTHPQQRIEVSDVSAVSKARRFEKDLLIQTRKGNGFSM